MKIMLVVYLRPITAKQMSLRPQIGVNQIENIIKRRNYTICTENDLIHSRNFFN